MRDIYAPQSKLILVTGNYGSGKSEISINYALALSDRHSGVTIVDLDVINPYFRCREAAELLRRREIKVVIPEGERRYADLPIIVPQVKGAIMNHQSYTILDVGGEDVGARVLASLTEAFQSIDSYEFLVVVNANRPFTSDSAGAAKVISMIGEASGLKPTALISNAHLLEHTDVQTILDGYKLTKQVSEETGLPIYFVAVQENFVKEIESQIASPLLPLKRILLPPHLVQKETFR